MFCQSESSYNLTAYNLFNGKLIIMTIRKFNTRAEKLLKKSEIRFVDFINNQIKLKNGKVVKLVPVMYRGHMRFAIPK